jgi:hypothetical protein
MSAYTEFVSAAALRRIKAPYTPAFRVYQSRKDPFWVLLSVHTRLPFSSPNNNNALMATPSEVEVLSG